MIKTLTTFAALLTTALSTAAPALARTSYEGRQNHGYLLEMVEAVGVNVRINQAVDCHPRYNDGNNYFGSYNGRTREMTICQEELMATNDFRGQIVNFTEEDLDTIRHEAHHLVQDCMDRRLDSQLLPVYNDPIGLATKVLSTRKAQSVVKAYAERGEHIVVLELEAFSVALMNNPLEQIDDIKKYCMGHPGY